MKMRSLRLISLSLFVGLVCTLPQLVFSWSTDEESLRKYYMDTKDKSSTVRAVVGTVQINSPITLSAEQGLSFGTFILRNLFFTKNAPLVFEVDVTENDGSGVPSLSTTALSASYYASRTATARNDPAVSRINGATAGLFSIGGLAHADNLSVEVEIVHVPNSVLAKAGTEFVAPPVFDVSGAPLPVPEWDGEESGLKLLRVSCYFVDDSDVYIGTSCADLLHENEDTKATVSALYISPLDAVGVKIVVGGRLYLTDAAALIPKRGKITLGYLKLTVVR